MNYYTPSYPGKAHVVDTSTTSANVNLSHDCRRIRIKAHTQDVFTASVAQHKLLKALRLKLLQ